MEESKILSCAWMWSEGRGDTYVFPKEALLDFAKELLTISQQAEPAPAQTSMQGNATMDDAIRAGDEVLLNEQAALLRECRAALDSLIQQKPTLAGLLAGSTTLGNLRADLYAYRPQSVMGEQTAQEK